MGGYAVRSQLSGIQVVDHQVRKTVQTGESEPAIREAVVVAAVPEPEFVEQSGCEIMNLGEGEQLGSRRTADKEGRQWRQRGWVESSMDLVYESAPQLVVA